VSLCFLNVKNKKCFVKGLFLKGEVEEHFFSFLKIFCFPVALDDREREKSFFRKSCVPKKKKKKKEKEMIIIFLVHK
jgi:hypothetical protein